MQAIRSCSIAALLAVFGSSGVPAAQQPPASERLRSEFRNPPKAFRPMVRWWWPGGDVTDQELQREVRLMDEANIGGAEIQPFRSGLNPKAPADVQARVDDYLTPTFFGHVRAALETARSRGMWLDFTFGSGWPFGGGNAITPELSATELRFSAVSVRGPAKFNGKLSWPKRGPSSAVVVALGSGTLNHMPEDWQQRLKAREKLVAVLAIRGEAAVVEANARKTLVGVPDDLLKKTGMLEPGTAVILTDRLSPDGTLEWDVPEGTWQIFTFVQFPADALVIAGVGNSPQLVLDHLNRAAMDAHIRRVGGGMDQYIKDYFGNGLRAIFCDSLEVPGYVYWTDNFQEEFRRRRGYDLLPFLPLAKIPGIGDPWSVYDATPMYDMKEIGSRIRYDCLRTISDLIIDNFYQPFSDWARQNRLLSRVQAHGSPTDVLTNYGLADIPEAENSVPSYDFLKFSASASHLYGHRITSCESFVFFGKLYQITPETIKRYADEMIAAGINQIIYHGFPYEYMDRPEPGWHPFAPGCASHINPHNPFWEFLPAINAYITRLQYLSQIGTNVAPVALYRGRLDYVLSYGFDAKLWPEPEMASALLRAGYNYDHINAEALQKSRAEGGRLISPGGASYRQLVFYQEGRIPLEVAEKISELVTAGVPVLFVGGIPGEEIGYLDYQARSRRIARIMTSLRGRVQLAKTVPEAMKALSASLQPNLRFLTPAKGVSFIQENVGQVSVYFLRNGNAAPINFEAEFQGDEASPETWDPWTGDTVPLSNFRRAGKAVRAPIELEPYGSRVIVFDPADRHPPAPVPKRETLPPMPIGESGWTLDITGRPSMRLAALVDWSRVPELRHFSGKGRYSTTFHLNTANAGGRLELDLGDVKDVAEIRVNGKKGPVLLCRPYRADITSMVQPGANTLEITVTNSLFNRLSGAGMRLTDTPGESLPAGLLGPVRILRLL